MDILAIIGALLVVFGLSYWWGYSSGYSQAQFNKDFFPHDLPAFSLIIGFLMLMVVVIFKIAEVMSADLTPPMP